MDSELRRAGGFVLAVTLSALGAVIQARGNGGTSNQVLLLDLSLIAILLSLASFGLHSELHHQLRLPLARNLLRIAELFTAVALVLLIASSISPSLRWAPFAVFFSTLLFFVCFKRLPATSLHYVAALRRYKFVVFLIGPAADDDVQWPSNQLSPTSMDEKGGQYRDESEAAPVELELRARE